tara:strand:+ start:559 stop:1272 length:714 start_codon:yes stop_codon:yes gene_type:complete
MPKNILITGASSDIGIEVINKFLENNFKITAHINRNKNIKKKFKNNDNIQFITYDFSKINKTENFINKNKKLLKKFDIYVNLIGLNKPMNFYKINSKHLYEHINSNYISSLFIAREILLSTVKKKWGRILFTSSIGTKFGGGEKTFSYSLSKYLNEFIPRHFKNAAKYNVLSNCLRIGVTDTKIHKNVRNKNMLKRAQLIPTKTISKPIDIAEYIYFLCSNKNKQITNKVLDISGGE